MADGLPTSCGTWHRLSIWCSRQDEAIGDGTVLNRDYDTPWVVWHRAADQKRQPPLERANQG
jgi:hypothetical protein